MAKNKTIDMVKSQVIYKDYSKDAERTALVSGENLSHAFGKIARWYTDISWVGHTHTVANITDFPTLGTAAAKNVSASGGDAGNDEVVLGNDSRLSDARTPTAHTHTEADITDLGPYADGDNNGAAISANKLNIGSADIGSETKPVYFSYLTGKPVACTYSLNASVPANAVFTDVNVKQSPSTANESREILFAGNAGNTETVGTVGKSNQLYFNPSTGALTAKSFSGSINASNLTGTIDAGRLPTTSVTAGSYGPAAGGTLAHGGTFDAAYVTVDKYGRLTAASTKTFTLPAQYAHPTYTSKTSGLYKITVDELGHVSGATAATASDLPSHTHPYIPLSGSTAITGELRVTMGETAMPTISVNNGTYRIGIHVGSGGVNHGIYDFSTGINTWMCYHNGTEFLFNGKANTAGKWATARKLTIGSSAKSVDGSGDVSWTLSEIGAAPTSHTHQYAKSSSINGPAYSVEGALGSTTVYRHVWFSVDSDDNRRAYNDNFKFEPSRGIIKFNGWLPIDLTGQTVNLNDYNDSGENIYGYRRYICKTTGGGSNISNKAVDAPFVLEVILIRWASTTDYITKQIYHGFDKKTYQRFCTNGTWSAWTEQKYTDTVYSHPTYTQKSSGLYKITVDNLGHVSGTAAVAASDLPSHTHPYLPLTGGTMTGAITFQVADAIKYNASSTTTNMISFITGASDGHGVRIGGGGLVVIGSGESSTALVSALSLTGNTEQTYIASDNNITFYSKCQTIGERLGIVFDNTGRLRPETDNTRTLGGTDFYWNKAYITQVVGRGTGGSWILSRDNAIVRQSSMSTNSAYFPVISAKTKIGEWSVGTLGPSSEHFYFSYTLDTNYSAGTNTSKTYYISTDGWFNGTAAKADKWTTARKLTLTGSVTGSASIDGSGDVSLSTTTNHTHSQYLPLAGGTMTGILNLWGNRYDDNYALNCNNSTIIGANAIKFNDLSDSAGEGIMFYRSATTWDSVWAKNGVLYFTPNHPTDTTNNVVYHSGNLSISRSLTSGTKIATITLNGTATDLYCQTNTNTDTMVTQSETTTSSYRNIMAGYNSAADASTSRTGTVTNVIYSSNSIFMQPSSGSLYAKVLNAYNANADASMILNRGGSSTCWRFLNTGGTLKIQCDWTTEKVSYFDVLTLGNNKGTMTSNVYLKLGSSNTTTLPTCGLFVHDIRDVAVPASGLGNGQVVNFYFHNTGTPNSDWWSIMHVKGWYGAYCAWELAGTAHNGDGTSRPLYVRTTNSNTAWGSWRKIYDTSNKPTPSEIGAAASSHTHSYIPLAGSKDVTGEIATTSANGYRLVYNKYGAIIRNDGQYWWFLITAQQETDAAAKTASWADTSGLVNNAHPLRIALSDGRVTINGYTINKSVPSTAVFTDTTYTIATGDSNGQIKVTPSSGSAYNVSVKGLGSAAYTASTAYATSSHTHNYAGSSSAGGAATSANKLNTNAGSATNPVYFSGGVPVACTYSLQRTVLPNYSVTSSNTANYPYHLLCSMKDTTAGYKDYWAVFRVTPGYNGQYSGVYKVTVRMNNGSASSVGVSLLSGYPYLNDVAKVVAGYNTSGTNTYLYVFLVCPTYARTTVSLLQNGSFTFYSSNEVADTTTSDKKTSVNVYASLAAAGTALVGGSFAGTKTSVDVTNYSNIVSTVVTDPSSSTSYGVLFAETPNTSQCNYIRKSNDFRINHYRGAANTEGWTELVLGNSTASTAANNSTGRVTVYNAKGAATQIVGNTNTSTVTITLPSSTGTLALTGHTHSYLPLSGGTMTGAITFQVADAIKYNASSATLSMISFMTGTADGHGIRIGGGGAVVIGSGESSTNLVSNLSITGQTETTYVSSDNNIEFYTGCQTIANKKRVTIDSNGHIIIGNNQRLLQNQNDTSNYSCAIRWCKNSTDPGNYGPEIGQHNTGDTDGSICILPYHTTSSPWEANVGLYISKTRLRYNGTAISLDGHTHNYLPLSGGTISSSSFGPLVIKRTGSTNGAGIKFYNQSGSTDILLGAIGMSGSANGGLIRWNSDLSTSYKILDTGNFSVSRSLTSGTKIATITVNGTATDLYCQTNTNTDTLVTQTNTTADGQYRVVLSGTNDDTTRTETARKSVNLRFNPGTSRLFLRGTTTASVAYGSTNPAIRFENSNASQNIELILNDFDSICKPASLAMIGNQGGEYLLAPNISAWDFTNNKWCAELRSFTIGTTSTVGEGRVVLGNGTKKGTAGNAKGVVEIYGEQNGCVFLEAPASLTEFPVIILPSTAGTMTNIVYQSTSSFVANTDTGLSQAINKLSTGSSAPTDADYYVAQYAGGGTTTTSYHRRTHSALFSYINSKLHKILWSGSTSCTARTSTDITLTTAIAANKYRSIRVVWGTSSNSTGVSEFRADTLNLQNNVMTASGAVDTNIIQFRISSDGKKVTVGPGTTAITVILIAGVYPL